MNEDIAVLPQMPTAPVVYRNRTLATVLAVLS